MRSMHDEACEVTGQQNRAIQAAGLTQRQEHRLQIDKEIEVLVLDARILTWGLPRFQSDMAAAIDLFACLDEILTLLPATPAQLVPTGIALLMGDPHMAGLVAPRSGLSHKKGLVMGNTVGVIDADYTGQILVSAWNRNPPGTPPIVIEPGERIAQMLFVPILRPRFRTVERLSATTARGAGGFGSTGPHAIRPPDAPDDDRGYVPTGGQAPIVQSNASGSEA